VRVLRYIPALLLLACGFCRGEAEGSAPEEKLPEEAPLVSPLKTFSIVRVNPDEQTSVAEKIVFKKSTLEEVPLECTSWRGLYHVSPDDRWILRDQKTGSGESMAMLYRVEENGRVTEVANFDENLWIASDAVSRLKRKEKQLYHTGVGEVVWSTDSGTVTVTVSGTNFEKSGDGIRTRIAYDIVKNTFTGEPFPDKDEQDSKR